MIINSVDMPDFEKKEFSEDPEKYADRRLLRAIQVYRNKLGSPFYLSPRPGALARSNGSITSEHRIIIRDKRIIKFSTAIDGFPAGSPFRAFMIAQNCGLFNGVGVYFDTERKGRPWIMLHLDLRPHPLIWYRDDHKYHYPSEQGFYDNLLKLFTPDERS